VYVIHDQSLQLFCIV